MADQHRAAARLDSGGEGEKIAAFQRLQGAAVNRQPGVGVGVVAVAGEMLQNAADLVGVHQFDGSGDKIPGGCGVLPQRALVHKGVGVFGNVAHRPQIDVDPERLQQLADLLLVGKRLGQAAAGKGFPGRGEALGTESGIAADPGNGSALFVHGQQHWNARGGQIAGQRLPEGIRRLPFKIRPEQDESAQMVLLDVRQRGFGVAARQKQLADPLLNRHGIQKLLNRVGGRRGDGDGRLCGNRGFGRGRRERRLRRLHRGSGAAGEKKQYKQNGESFHGCTSKCLEWESGVYPPGRHSSTTVEKSQKPSA